MKIAVISKHDAAERRASAQHQLAKLGLKFEFFNAVDGLADPREHFQALDPTLFRLNACRDPLPGEIGCHASHRALWKLCAAGNEPFVILEDDFVLEPPFVVALPEVEKLARLFGFIRLQSFDRKRALGKSFRRRSTPLIRRSGLELHYVSDVPLCLLAYAISPKSALALSRASTTMYAPVDKFLQQTWNHRTPIFALTPPLVSESPRAYPSTIGERSNKSRSIGLLAGRAVYKGIGELRRIGFDLKCMREARKLSRVIATMPPISEGTTFHANS